MDLLKVPKASENMDEATLGRWLKQEGEPVAEGEAVLELITDKAEFELPAEKKGILLKRYAAEHSILPVGFVLAAIGAPGESPPDDVEALNAKLLAARDPLKDVSVNKGALQTADANVRATPKARKLAKEKGVSLGDVARMTGGGKILDDKDVERYLARENG